MIINVEIDTRDGHHVKGSGSNLFSVLYITDEELDSYSDLWMADSEEDLKVQVGKEYVGEDTDPQVQARFEEDWDISIKPNYIGKLTTTYTINEVMDAIRK